MRQKLDLQKNCVYSENKFYARLENYTLLPVYT